MNQNVNHLSQLKDEFQEFRKRVASDTKTIHYPKNLIDHAIKAVRRGQTVSEIARITGIKRDTLSKQVLRASRLKKSKVMSRLEPLELKLVPAVNVSEALVKIKFLSGAFLEAKLTDLTPALIALLNSKTNVHP